MQTMTTVGLDIAKSVFQVHGVDASGQMIIRRQLKRRHVLAFFQKLPACLIGIEDGHYRGGLSCWPSHFCRHDERGRQLRRPYSSCCPKTLPVLLLIRCSRAQDLQTIISY